MKSLSASPLCYQRISAFNPKTIRTEDIPQAWPIELDTRGPMGHALVLDHLLVDVYNTNGYFHRESDMLA